MSGDQRRYLREILDEFDHYFEDFEKSVEESIRASVLAGGSLLRRPVISGVAVGLTPEGRPSVQFFGDHPRGTDTPRTPVYEQASNAEEGTLRLLVELPGVEKGAIEVSAQEHRVAISTNGGGRKYSVEVPLKTEVDPDSGKASFLNGLLEITFNSRDKTNKGYRRVSVV